MAGGSPKKRKAPSNESGKVTFQVESSASNGNPVVVSFPGGIPESVKRGQDQNRPKFLWKKLSQKSSLGRRIAGEDKHCVYSGHAAGLAYDDRRTKLCVGVYDRKRGVVVVREAASKGTVFALEQSVPSYIEKNGNVDTHMNRGSLMSSRKLFEDFGSAKKQKVLRSQAANQVDINHVVGAGTGSAAMNQVIQGTEMSESNRKAVAESKNRDGTTVSSSNTAVDAAHEAARRNFLPAYDDKAVKPDRVYSARAIAEERAWDKIYKRVHACSKQDDVSTAVIDSVFKTDWNSSVLKIVNEVSPDKQDAKDRYTCAILANYLIKFYHGNHKRKTINPPDETKPSYFGIPVEVASRWIALFTTTVPADNGKLTHAMSKQNKDKCIIHALLLYMMAQGKAMKIGDVRPIAEDLKVPVNDCAQMLRLAGCQVTKKGVALSAVLKTPLKFPPPKKLVSRGR